MIPHHHMKQAFLFLLLFPASLLAQHAPPAWRVGLGLGYSHAALRDEAVTYLTRRGSTGAYQLRLERETQRTCQQVTLGYGAYTRLASDYGNATEVLTAHLTYTYLHRVGLWRGWTGWAGGSLSSQLYGLTYLDGFGNAQNGSLFSGIGLSAMATRSVGRSRLGVQGGLGLVQYAIQPNYSIGYLGVDTAGDWLRSGQVRAFPQVTLATLRVSYDAWLSPRTALRFDYHWQLLRTNSPRHTGLLTNQLLATLLLRIGRL